MADPLRPRQIDRIADLVLGGRLQFTPDEAAAAAGVSLDASRPYWRAMGFADVGTTPEFTQEDVECLRLLVGWVRDGRMSEPTSIDLTRGLGQACSRLADWQVATMAGILAERTPVDLDRVADGVAAVLPGLERLLVHAWRRHLAAVIGRAMAGLDSGDPLEAATGSVGFADIAGFTRLARNLGDDELAAMVEAFETGAADIVAAQGARLVKTLGDEVMFVAADPACAVGIALAMHDVTAPGPEALSLRIGVATGRLVMRMGDVYGETVNLASRLTAVARPGSTLVDEVTAEGLAAAPGLVVRPLPPRPLRGMGVVRTSTVARAPGRRQSRAASSSGKTQVR